MSATRDEMTALRDAIQRALRALFVDRFVHWLGASRRNRLIFVGIYVAISAVCVTAAVLGLGAWPHG